MLVDLAPIGPGSAGFLVVHIGYQVPTLYRSFDNSKRARVRRNGSGALGFHLDIDIRRAVGIVDCICKRHKPHGGISIDTRHAAGR